MKNLILACFLLGLTACTAVPTKEASGTKPDIPDVFCSANELYLVYEVKELVVKITGVFCVTKDKGNV